MDFFTFVFLVVLVGCAVGAYSIWQDGQNKRRHNDGDLDNLVGEIEALRERVQVLEEIVTDQKYQLRRELDNLEAPGRGNP